jgi:hypothetical protein
VTAVILPLSVDCQNKVCVERHILEKVANQLDSFEVAKKIQDKCEKFKDSSLMIISTQHMLIDNLDVIIENQKMQIGNLEQVEIEYTETLKVSDEYIKSLKKEKRKLKTKYTFSLIGGGVLTIGLTTALLISLF